MSWLSDETVGHLRDVADWPDLDDTRYEVLGLAGSGGMGKVYRVRDRELERDVALKVLNVPRITDAAKARMVREARILARLEHPSIVPVHDVGVLPDGRPYYTMKLVDGARLDEWSREDRSLTERLRVFERVCEGVAFAHAHDVIHRDLKPENVMVGAFGEVLVMDWGVAKILGEAGAPAADDDRGTATGGAAAADTHDDTDADTDVPAEADALAATDVAVAATRTTAFETEEPEGTRADGSTHPGTILGTPGWMPPEQAGGDTDRVDRRSDVYALGAILGDLLRNAVPGIPRPLSAVIAKATAAEPHIRYPGVDALRDDVSRFLGERTVSAYRESARERLARFLRKYRTPLALVVVYVIVRILILVFAGT